MGIITVPKGKYKKNHKFLCPYESDSKFCVGSCHPRYFCRLPFVGSRNAWRKKKKKNSMKGYEKSWKSAQREAEHQLSVSSAIRGL